MKAAYRGVAILVAHCALVLSVAGKYAWDRDRLPRAWANATPVDPDLPIRGRYLTLQLRAEPGDRRDDTSTVRLSVEKGKLVAYSDPKGAHAIWRRSPEMWVLTEPVAFFLPEHAPDPSLRQPGRELWVEVSVPPHGPPRPIRLQVR